MKQGRFITRVITFAIVACVLAYMGFQIADSLFNPIRTVNAALYRTEDTIPVNGYFIRDEQPLENTGGGIADVCVPEGRRVGKSEPIAEVFPDESSLAAKRQLDLLDERISRLENANRGEAESADAEKLDDLIREQIHAVGRVTDERDFTSLREQSSELKSLVFRREYAFSGEDELASVLSGLKAQRETTAQACKNAKAVLSPESGVFSGMVDGYEKALTPEVLKDLTVAGLDGFPSLAQAAGAAGCLGKLIHGFDWYYACAVPSPQAGIFKAGDRVSLRFAKGFDGPLEVRVYSVGTDENGRTAVVFTSEDYLSRVASFRRLSADIVCRQYEGIKVPREALRVSEGGVSGVFCLVGLQAKFKPVEIIYDSGTYCLAAYRPDENNALRPGDEIVTAARGLFDGKIVK